MRVAESGREGGAHAAADRTTIARLLLDRADDPHPGVRTRDRTWSWAETVRESAARGALADAVFVDGPRHIGVLLDNDPEYLFWLGGAALTGATIVGINSTRRGAMLEAEIRFADCRIIVTDSAGLELLAGLDVGVPPERILVTDGPGYAEAVDAHRLPAGSAVQADASAGEDALMLLLFTSGTTGMSKAVKCSQGRLARLGYRLGRKYAVTRDDVCYCCMPLFHGNALMSLWAPALAAGATVCLTPKFTASGFLDDVRHFGATFFTYVGKALGYLMLTPERPDDADNTLTHGFGTEASPDDQAEFRRRFGAVLYEGYGSSEGSGSVRRAPDAPEGALGRPAHEDIVIVDPDTLAAKKPALLDRYGRVQNPDEAIGEIVDKRGARAFEGYYKNDAADAERLRHGWYWTGDLGYVDVDGFIYFAGRKGDWIRVDGENTSALLIERILRRHPQVATAVAFAVPDPRSGDQVMAAVEVQPGAEFDTDEFVGFLAAQNDLGTKATPRLLRVSRGLPTTGSNKVQKKVVARQAWRCDEPVYRWAGRGGVHYEPMSAEQMDALEAEFATYGRTRLLPPGAAAVGA